MYHGDKSTSKLYERKKKRCIIIIQVEYKECAEGQIYYITSFKYWLCQMTIDPVIWSSVYFGKIRYACSIGNIFRPFFSPNMTIQRNIYVYTRLVWKVAAKTKSNLVFRGEDQVKVESPTLSISDQNCWWMSWRIKVMEKGIFGCQQGTFYSNSVFKRFKNDANRRL